MHVLPSAVFWLMPKCPDKGLLSSGWVPAVANTGVRSDWPRDGLAGRLGWRINGLCLIPWQHWCAYTTSPLWRTFRHRNERSPLVC